MKTQANSSEVVICFGEVLWDSLPNGMFPGGAPINVAYHLKRLERQPLPVTAVGNDFLGEDLRRRIKRWGLDTSYITTVPEKQTGVVVVEVDQKGSPSYEIRDDVAWDWIILPATLEEEAARSQAVVYGTLAQRHHHNRQQLGRLLQCAPETYKVYDVNLRPPYDSPDLVWDLAQSADVIKLNHDELNQLLKEKHAQSELEQGARALAEAIGCSRICVTAGGDGAGLLWDEAWHWTDGQPIQVKDTVGAGDAFLAGLVHGLLGKSTPEQTIREAARLGEFVATCEGATPSYTVDSEGRFVRT